MKTNHRSLFAQQSAFSSLTIVKKIVSFTCFFLIVIFVNAQEINIYSGCNLVLDGNVNLVVNNIAFKNNGTFAAGTSTVSFTGNTDTTISYLSGSSNTRFNNLTLDKSAYGTAVKSSAGVKNILTVSAGTLYADSNLTLLSDASNTARLASVPSGANVLGKVMVERYIPAKRAWRLMTAPVTNASSIYNTWQNKGVYTAGRGLLVSGPGGSNGLDNTNASSLKTWDLSSQALVPVTSTYTNISPTNTGSADNTGYFVFIRGDRNIANFTIPNTNVTTLSGIGSLQVGTQNFTASSTAGKYTLIGNPYASPINFNSVSRTNLVKRFYVWDPTINVYGGYVTLDDLDGDGVYSKSVAGSAQTKEIQSSQAFFVETTSNGSASLTITEAAKSTTNNSNVFRPGSPTESIRTDLFLLNDDSSLVLADGALVEYNSVFEDAVTNEDALKFTNISENLGILHHGTTLSIERRPTINAGDTLFLNLSKTTRRNYQLKITPSNVEQQGLTAFLEDKYLVKSSEISLSGANEINFSVDADPASAASSRFKIVFRPLSVLAVAFRFVKAYQVNDKVEVNWKMEDETNIIKYEVERSTNGISFSKVNANDKNTSGNYSWTDANAFAGKTFYRIKSINSDGSITYSQVVNVLIIKNAGQFTIEPNPVKGNAIQLHFANQAAGTYQFNLVNTSGQLVYQSKVQISGSSTSQLLRTNTALMPGVYQLQVTGPSNTVETQKVIIEQ